MVRRLQRQLPFLRSVLREADQHVRRERLQHANTDQVNAISELVMNTLKGNVTVPPRRLDPLRPHKQALREMARRKHSIKRRRQVMMAQTGAGMWHALDRVCRHCLSGSVTGRTRKSTWCPRRTWSGWWNNTKAR